MENFFGLLKSELLYLEKFASYEDFISKLKDYIDYYNTKRIKLLFLCMYYTFCPLICPTTLPTIRPTTNGVTQPNPTADKGMTETMDFAASKLLSPGNASISA